MKGDLAIMARDGYLVVVHGEFKSAYDSQTVLLPDEPIVSQFDPEQDRRDAIQHEFDTYLEQVILPLINDYARKLNSRSTMFVMPPGWLRLPADAFDLQGIKVITGANVKDIRIDVPGVDSLST